VAIVIAKSAASLVTRNTAQDITAVKTFTAKPRHDYVSEEIDMNEELYDCQPGEEIGDRLIEAFADTTIRDYTFTVPGDYLLDQTIVIQRSDFRFHCVPGVRFVIDSTDNKGFFVAGNDEGVYYSNIEFDHFAMYDPDPIGHTGLVEQSHGVVLKRVDGFEVHHIEFEGMGDEAIDTGHSKNGEIHHNTLINCVASAGGSNGAIGVNCASNLKVYKNRATGQAQGQFIRIEIADTPDPGEEVGHHRIYANVSEGHNALTSCITFAQGLNGQIVDVVIEENTIIDCGHIPIQIAVTSGGVNAKDIQVLGNIIRRGGSYDPAGADRGAISFGDDRVENAVCRDNKVLGWGTVARHHGIRMFSGICTDNLVADAADCGIRCESGSSGFTSKVEDNTVLRAGLLAASGTRAGLVINGTWRAKGNDIRSSFVGESLIGTSGRSFDSTLLSNTTARTYSSSATSAQVRENADADLSGFAAAGHTHTTSGLTYRKTANQSVSTLVLEDIVDLAHAVLANEVVYFRLVVFTFSAATTTGPAFGWTVPVGYSGLKWGIYYPRAATAVAVMQGTTPGNPAVGDQTVSSTAGRMALVSGVFRNGSTAGTLQFQMASEVDASAVTIEADSYMEVHG
jgi:hypothetical protein